MPETLGLSKDSDHKKVQEAVGHCIRKMRREGRPADQAAAICYSMAEKETGKKE